MSNSITNRHDILVLFDVENGNPNGDPDAGNMPRIDPNTNKGIVSDVCLKRKIRNYVKLFASKKRNDDKGYNIIVSQGNVINNDIKKAEDESKDEPDNNRTKEEKTRDWLCREFFDIRTFGGVLSTGVLKGSSYGQVRGPVQFTFSKSFHPITPLEITITRCAVTDEKDKAKERTMGNKHIVPYALYAVKCYISPAFAEKTGFCEKDLGVFFEALENMFEHDRSAARGEMRVRGIYDFEHIGTQHENNAEQNKKEAKLGCCHAHKLFEGIEINLKDGKTFPDCFEDYEIRCNWDREELPRGVKLNVRH